MQDDRGQWRLQFGAVCVTAAGLFGLLALGSAYHWELEHQFICDADNCVRDRRSWVEAHLLGSVALLALAALGVALLTAHFARRDRPA